MRLFFRTARFFTAFARSIASIYIRHARGAEGGLFVYQYYTRDDLNIGCINDTLRGRLQVYRARICQAYYQRYGMIRLYCVVLITTISHGVRELQRGLQFRSVDNHRTVVRYFSDSRRRAKVSPRRLNLLRILFTLSNCLLSKPTRILARQGDGLISRDLRMFRSLKILKFVNL